MSEVDVVQIGVEVLERGVFDEVFLLKLAEYSRNVAVLARLARHENCMLRAAVAGNHFIGKDAVDILERDFDPGVARVLLLNPTYIAMQEGNIIDITNAVSSRAGDIKQK